MERNDNSGHEAGIALAIEHYGNYVPDTVTSSSGSIIRAIIETAQRGMYEPAIQDLL